MRALTDEERLTEAMREIYGGEDHMFFELAAAEMLKRGIRLRPECVSCGLQWAPGGQVDDGRLTGRRKLLLICPNCLDAGPEPDCDCGRCSLMIALGVPVGDWT
jgi:hypothetical protein